MKINFNFSQPNWDGLVAAVRMGDRRTFERHFGACLPMGGFQSLWFGAKSGKAYLLQRIADEIAPAGCGFPPDLKYEYRRMLAPYKLYREFVSGRDVAEALAQVAEAFIQGVTPADFDAVLMAGAICVFAGDAERLATLSDLRGVRAGIGASDFRTYTDVFAAYRLLLERGPSQGVLSRLDLLGDSFGGAASFLPQMRGKFPLTHLRLPCFELYAAVCAALYKDAPLRCLSVGVTVDSLLHALDDVRGTVDCALLADVSRILAAVGEDGGSFGSEAVPPGAFTPPPLASFNRLLMAHVAGGEGVLGGDARPHVEAARALVDAGQLVLGATAAGFAMGWPSVSESAGAVVAAAAHWGVKPLFKMDPRLPAWQLALDELGKFIDGADAAPAAVRDPFFWLLTLSRVGGPETFKVVDLGIWRRRVLKSGKLGKGKVHSVGEAERMVGELETLPQDDAVFAALWQLSGEFGFPRGFRSAGNPGKFACLLRSLVGHPRVAAMVDGEDFEATPIELSAYAPKIETSRTPEGELVLELPRELRELGSEAGSGRALLRLGPGKYGALLCGAELQRAAEIILKRGSGGKVVIPGAAAEDAANRIAQAAKTIPMHGVITEDGDLSKLPRVAASPLPHLRLSLEDDDALEIALRVVVDEGTGKVVYAPGFGPGEVVARQAGEAVAVVRDKSAEEAAAKPVRDLLGECPGVKAMGVDDWRAEGLAEILGALDGLRSLGDAVALDWLDPDRVLKVASVSGAALDARPKGAGHWFGVSGNFDLDNGKVLSFEEMLKSMPAKVGGYVRLSDGEYVRVSRKLRERLEMLGAAGDMRDGELDVPVAALPAIDGAFGGAAENDGAAAFALPEAMERRATQIRDELARDVAVPEGLAAELRPYQCEGFVWLDHLAGCGIGACLADDMGLGKTLEIIAVLLARAADGASLVVAPTSVCGNWESEIRRFAPGLVPKPVGARESAAEVVKTAGRGDVVIASYGLAVTKGDILASRHWNGVVLDEAQAIKNAATKRAKGVKKLAAQFRVAATGTPVENRLSEFWSLFDFLNPGMLLSQEKFVARYTQDGMATAGLKKLVSPLVLRRLKKDVLKDLPPKTEVNLFVELESTERAAYEACRRQALEAVEQAKEAGKAASAGMLVLRELTRLRRFCCHPSLVLPELVASAKLDALADLLADLREGDHRALVFSQYTDYLAIVGNMVGKNGWSYQYLDGSTPRDERLERVERFQKGEGDFFLISLKAGGFGLNLTAANYVILLDPWWNPAVENQAADRVHRIGQTEPVTVYRLVAKDTIEERVVALHADKLKIADDLLEGAGSAALTLNEMMGLFS